MATFYGTDAQSYLTAKTTGGREYKRMALDVMIWKDSYTCAGTEAADDIIKLFREIPAGSVVIPVYSRIHTIAQPAATAFAIDLGILADDDIIDGVSVNSVGIVTPTEREVEITEAAQPYATLKTVTGTVTAGRVIDFYLAVRQTS